MNEMLARGAEETIVCWKNGVGLGRAEKVHLKEQERESKAENEPIKSAH